MIELSTGETWLSIPTSPIVASTAVKRQDERNAGRDQGAEGDQEDHERDRQRGHERLLEVVADRVVELLVDARVADLLDGEVGIGGLRGGRGVQGRADAVLGLVLVAGDLEAKQGGVPVGRDLPVDCQTRRGSRSSCV